MNQYSLEICDILESIILLWPRTSYNILSRPNQCGTQVIHYTMQPVVTIIIGWFNIRLFTASLLPVISSALPGRFSVATMKYHYRNQSKNRVMIHFACVCYRSGAGVGINSARWRHQTLLFCLMAIRCHDVLYAKLCTISNTSFLGRCR